MGLLFGYPAAMWLEHLFELEDALNWLRSRVWPEEYGAVRDALENFRRVLDAPPHDSQGLRAGASGVARSAPRP